MTEVRKVAAESRSKLIPVENIKESKHNPRHDFADAGLRELADSIRTQGILQPLLVRPTDTRDTFEVVAGARRLRAAKMAGVALVPAVIREFASDEEAQEAALVENLQRIDLAPLEEAAGFDYLLRTVGLSVEQIAQRVAKSRGYVYDRLRLLTLTPELKTLLRAGELPLAHAVLLSRLPKERQKDALGGGLFVPDATLFVPDAPENKRYQEAKKPVSIRELQNWIDKHVRFDPSADVSRVLFPETVQAREAAVEKKEKVVSITYEHMVLPDAREEGERTIGPRSWKRADGQFDSKVCDLSVIGVVVVGAARGDSFRVCIDKKKCKTHWGTEQREAAKLAKQVASGQRPANSSWREEQQKWERQRQREDAGRKRWTKALPVILEAVAEKVGKTKAGPTGLLGKVLINGTRVQHIALPKGTDTIAVGSTPESLVRYCAYQLLRKWAGDWNGHQSFPKVAKSFGIDLAKILEQFPLEIEEEKKVEVGKEAAEK